MKNYRLFNRTIFILLLLIVMVHGYGQTGLNFQGVARTNNNIILASQPISLRLSILQGSASGIAEYVETRRVTTNAQGLFTAVIGDTGAISTLGNFTTINWRNTPKFLKIEMDVAAGTNFITMGTTQFQYVAYAQFANSVDADNITGVVPVARGGTGANSLSSFKITLALNNVNNTSDLTKPISTATQTALDLKLNAADTVKYVKQTYADSALLTKFNLKDTVKFTKQTYADSALLTKLKLTDTASMLSNRIGKDTLNLSARINLKANGSDMTSGLLLKENASNKSTATDLGGTSPSDILFPTQKAVKEYVTANASSGGVTDGGITTIKLADGAVTDAKINTVSGSKVIGNITGNAATATLATNATTAGNITATTNTTLTSLSSLATVGTITSGVWSGTSVAVEKGGTGATTASAARTNLGLEIGTNVQAPLVAGTNYLAPTGSAASLTNFPTFNQNTTGNAATATTAGNITATTNTTLTSLSSLTSVGTIASLTTGAITNSGKVIVGASSEASASAVLEASSTTQGFLPPRMTKAQRDAIISPAAGLTIWNTTYVQLEVYNGSLWVNMNGTSDQVPTIGQYFQGGIVAYILLSGDPGYDATTQHGLIAATSDQSTGIQWSSFTTTGATGTEIGTGLSNTNTIISSQGPTATSYAAGLARAYKGGGYTDWYLPSKNELAKLYAMKLLGFGGFANSHYWSSTVYANGAAWGQHFTNGSQYGISNNDAYYVRAIRAF